MLDIIMLHALTDNYVYLLHESVDDKTAVVDPAEAEPVLDLLAAKGWQLDCILNTHHHHDHIGANLQLKQATDCKIIGSYADRERIPGLDIGLEQGDIFKLGQHKAKIIETPGHTAGHIVFYFADDNALFCGDTLFSLGCGRLFEGSAEQMWHSLNQLKGLPAETRIYCAHEYTQANGRFAVTIDPENADLQKRIAEVERLRTDNRPSIPSTMAQELACNPFLRADNTAIRQLLNMSDESDSAVFAEIRKRKDRF